MRKRSLQLPKTLAEQRRQAQRGMNLYSPVSVMADPVVKRTGRTKPIRPVEASEADVLNAIIGMLKVHHDVMIAIRMNSGMAQSVSGAPVWFHKLLKGPGVVVDIIGVLRSGKAFAIEVKRANWSVFGEAANSATAKRERDQAQFLDHVKSLGGRAGFARSIGEAIAVIEGG